jgi:hypothetical protein
MTIWRSESMTLPITDGKGKVHVVAGIAILSFMFWPKQPREAFMLAEAWQSDLSLLEDGSLSEFVQSRLDQSVERATPGKFAGLVLTHFLALAVHHQDQGKASINKAQYLVWASSMRDKSDGTPTGRRWLKQSWADFLPAVHLWAAFSFTRQPHLRSAIRFCCGCRGNKTRGC